MRGRSIPSVRHPRSLWRQWPIKLETDFIITKKLKASLEGAGASLDSVVKAQVYLSDREDVPGFNEVWLNHFKTPPATTIIATTSPGFAISDLRIEINTISLATKGKTKRESDPRPAAAVVRRLGVGGEVRRPPVPLGADGARRGPPDRGGARRSAPTVLRHPGEGGTALHYAAGRGDLPVAGTSIRNAVRIQQFHTDLADLPAAIEVWAETMDHAPLPLSAIEVAWLPVPGARVMVDLWVHVPQPG